jgi:DnaK suppressor protein
MSGLTTEQRGALAVEITARRERTRLRLQQLDRDVAALFDATADAPDDEHDPEGATIGFERAQASTLRAEAQAQLEALDRAEMALADGHLDVCERCGGPIGFDRLLARPTTRRCIRCAT